MAGGRVASLKHVTVVPNNQLTMQWSATWVAFQQFATTKFMTSLPHCSLRSAIMSPLNHPSSHLMERPWPHGPPTLMIVLGWTFVQEVSGTFHKMHSLMYGFFTLTHLVTALQWPLLSTGDMNKQKNESTGSGWGKWSMECLLPVVFSATRGMGREATTFYKWLADMISLKRLHPYSTMIGWLRCRLFFAALRSFIMCIRGSRSSLQHPIYGTDISLATSKGRVPSV